MLVLAATAMGALVRPAPTAASSNREDEMRTQIAQLLNMERQNRSLRALPVNAHLQDTAQAWSERNRDSGCETGCHSSHDQGEILAWAGVTARSGQLAVAWMKSTSHRNIVLYPDATAMGVGVACKHGGEVYATVQFYDVYAPVPSTQEQPMASSEEWGSPCEGPAGAMPVSDASSTSTSTTVRRTTTTTTAAPRPRPTTTTAPPRPRPTPAIAPLPVATTPVAPPPTTATTSAPVPSTTTTTSPRVGLRADGTDVTALPTPTNPEQQALMEQSAATPANAEPAWIAIVVVVLLLSGMRVGSQLREVRAARRLEDG